MTATDVDVMVVACAEAWSGDGEILASSIGDVPRVAAGLAKLTTSPDLLMTDGEASLVAEPMPLGGPDGQQPVVEGWMPFRHIFDLIWNGRRHIMMGAAQMDRYGNTNISAVGEWDRPKAQLVGMRGAPGNTVMNVCSYWIPSHSRRVFVDTVDVISGLGYDPSRADTWQSVPTHEIRRVVTDLAVLDFDSPERTMRLRSVHPWATVDDVRERTGFDLVVPDDVATTRLPTDEERRLIREVLDPRGALHA